VRADCARSAPSCGSTLGIGDKEVQHLYVV
jgi:hypothetical protein